MADIRNSWSSSFVSDGWYSRAIGGLRARVRAIAPARRSAGSDGLPPVSGALSAPAGAPAGLAAAPLWGLTSIDTVNRAESREPRAESREPRAESREPRAESRVVPAGARHASAERMPVRPAAWLRSFRALGGAVRLPSEDYALTKHNYGRNAAGGRRRGSTERADRAAKPHRDREYQCLRRPRVGSSGHHQRNDYALHHRVPRIRELDGADRHVDPAERVACDSYVGGQHCHDQRRAFLSGQGRQRQRDRTGLERGHGHPRLSAIGAAKCHPRRRHDPGGSQLLHRPDDCAGQERLPDQGERCLPGHEGDRLSVGDVQPLLPLGDHRGIPPRRSRDPLLPCAGIEPGDGFERKRARRVHGLPRHQQPRQHLAGGAARLPGHPRRGGRLDEPLLGRGLAQRIAHLALRGANRNRKLDHGGGGRQRPPVHGQRPGAQHRVRVQGPCRQPARQRCRVNRQGDCRRVQAGLPPQHEPVGHPPRGRPHEGDLGIHRPPPGLPADRGDHVRPDLERAAGERSAAAPGQPDVDHDPGREGAGERRAPGGGRFRWSGQGLQRAREAPARGDEPRGRGLHRPEQRTASPSTTTRRSRRRA